MEIALLLDVYRQYHDAHERMRDLFSILLMVASNGHRQKSEFARRKGISPAMVTKLCRPVAFQCWKAASWILIKPVRLWSEPTGWSWGICWKWKKRAGISSEQPELPADDAGLAGGTPVLRCNSTRLRPQKKFIRQTETPWIWRKGRLSHR